jgi:hypothetical protein
VNNLQKTPRPRLMKKSCSMKSVKLPWLQKRVRKKK